MSRADAVEVPEGSSREPLRDVTEAFSGARLEQVVTPDGRRLVLKYLPSGGDWLTRATVGTGRPRRLWETGVLRSVERFVDHTILDVWSAGGHDVVVMRHARADLLPGKVPVSVDTSRQLLAGLSAMHEGCTAEHRDGFCSIAARYAMFAPGFHASDRGPGRHPLGDRIGVGWELYAQHVDADVVQAVFTIHREPDLLGRRLEDFPSTLLHGDAKLENLGLGRNRMVAIDWGDLTDTGRARWT